VQSLVQPDFLVNFSQQWPKTKNTKIKEG